MSDWIGLLVIGFLVFVRFWFGPAQQTLRSFS